MTRQARAAAKPLIEMIPPGTLVDTCHAARFLQLPVKTIRDLCNRGELTASRMGRGYRIRAEAIQEFIRRREVKPPAAAAQ